MLELDALLTDERAEQIAELAETAGAAIMEIYEGADFDTRYKEDESPLTAADLAAHRILVDGLERLTPQIPVLSEESSAAAGAERRSWETFWLVDPLDGTKEFIKRNGEFTVNVALIHNQRPVLGVVHAPALEATYWAVEGLGAFKRTSAGTGPIAVRGELSEPITVVVSRSHLRDRDEAFIAALRERFDEVELSPTGSALKLCLVAEGRADVYPRFGPTMEWDIAAAHCVVDQAGGVLQTEAGGPLVYNKEELVNPFFVARTPALSLP
jgi:3'(2'), 5'-bisphosphate nucleotidase